MLYSSIVIATLFFSYSLLAFASHLTAGKYSLSSLNVFSNSFLDLLNSLLLKAQDEIHSREILNTKKVDATALLNMVESELETNFRDKVFEALGDGYEKVRTAVVERNN